MCQKCEGICGLWVLNLQMGMGWIGLAVLFNMQATPKRLPQFFQHNIFLNCLIKKPQNTNGLTFLTHIILAISGMLRK